jgi:O-antigen ligase/polysaccharide polymerase Wzy-like membrane protein
VIPPPEAISLVNGALLLVLAWGALSLGAVYPWAYWPLAVGGASVGIAGLVAPAAVGRSPSPTLIGAFCLVAMMILLQIVPMPAAVVNLASPRRAAVWSSLHELSGDVRLGSTRRRSTAAPLSIDPPASVRAFCLYSAFALLTLGVARSLRDRDVRRLVALLVAFGAFLAFVGIFQRFTATTRIYGLWQPRGADATTGFGPFVNRNHFGGWMLMMTPLAFGFFCGLVSERRADTKKGWRDRILWLSSPNASQSLLAGFAGLAMALSLVLTLSRSAIACFLVVAAALCSWVVRRSTPGRALVVVAFLAGISVLTIRWAGTDAVAGRFREASLGDRAIAWTQAARIAGDFSLTGTGLNTYWLAAAADGQSEGRRFDQAHNDYLQLCAEGGFLVVGAAVVLLFAFVREVWRRFSEQLDSPLNYWVRVGATLGLLAIALQETVEFSLQMPGNAAMLALLAALAARGATPSAFERR